MPEEKKGSSYIETIVTEELAKLGSDGQRQAFARAIMMSIRLDRSASEPPQPYSAFEIKDETSFNVRIQKDKQILLSKAKAIEFLDSFGYSINSRTSFKKKHNKPNYEKFFLRDPAVAGRRSLLCTYAEWLHLEGFLFEPAFPEVLIPYLPSPEWRPNFRKTTAICDVNLLVDIEEAIQVGVNAAIRHLMEANGLELKQEFPPEKSSFHQRFQYATREVINLERLDELFLEAKHFLIRKFDGIGNAEETELDRASQELVLSLEDVPRAVIKLGKIYIVRTTEGEDKNTEVRMQSSALKDAYEENPLIIRDPQRVKQLL